MMACCDILQHDVLKNIDDLQEESGAHHKYWYLPAAARRASCRGADLTGPQGQVSVGGTLEPHPVKHIVTNKSKRTVLSVVAAGFFILRGSYSNV